MVVKLGPCKKEEKEEGKKSWDDGRVIFPSIFFSFFFLFYSDKSRVTIDFSFALLGGSPRPLLFSRTEYRLGRRSDADWRQGVMALLPISSRYGANTRTHISV